MFRRPPTSTLHYPLLPYTPLCRSRVRCGGERQKSRDHECRSAHGPSPSDRAIFARRRDGIEGLSPRRGAFEQIDADRSASFEKGGVRFTNLPDDLPAAVFGYDRALLVDQRRHDETFAVGEIGRAHV